MAEQAVSDLSVVVTIINSAPVMATPKYQAVTPTDVADKSVEFQMATTDASVRVEVMHGVW